MKYTESFYKINALNYKSGEIFSSGHILSTIKFFLSHFEEALLDEIENAKADGASEEEIDKLMNQWQEEQNEIDLQAKVRIEFLNLNNPF